MNALHLSTARGENSSEELEHLSFRANLYELLRSSSDQPAELATRLGQVVGQETSAIAVLLYDPSVADAPITVLHTRVSHLPENVLSWCINLAHRSLASGEATTEISKNQGNEEFFLTAVPTNSSQQICLCALHQNSQKNDVEELLELALLAAQRSRQAADDVAQQLAALQDLISRVERSDTLEAAAASTCDSLAQYLQLPHVVMATCTRNGRLKSSRSRTKSPWTNALNNIALQSR